ncbi:MAG: DNA alkylation repair protein [Muribaculaceae bacterium]|nr:DNA alkylation repair protein [Muribaculaceae bacterium]
MESILKDIKKDFFSLRNGIVAEPLRKLYPQGVIVYGLNVPQFMELAKKYPKDKSLGLKLWDDKNCRESRLLALYLIPPETLDQESAKKMVMEVQSSEEAEFLPFRLLRLLPFAKDFYENMNKVPINDELSSYCLRMLKNNLINMSIL